MNSLKVQQSQMCDSSQLNDIWCWTAGVYEALHLSDWQRLSYTAGELIVEVANSVTPEM